MTRITRRDFLKISSSYIVGSLLSKSMPGLSKRMKKHSNIIIIICDSLSARHLSLHGYPRLTTPNIDAFANSATVYHSHYSSGNFTTTGTASLLTGMLGWKHRAINQGGLIQSQYIYSHLYSLLKDDYYTFAFSQNPWADRLVRQSYQNVDKLLSPFSYSLRKDDMVDSLPGLDDALGSIIKRDFMFQTLLGPMGLPATGSYYKYESQQAYTKAQGSAQYPDGPPAVLLAGYVAPFLNEEIFKGVYSELSQLALASQPYLSYFHLFSPHLPYKPRKSFAKLFHDDYTPVAKPVHPLSPKIAEDFINSQRTAYDRQIAQVDREFGKLIASLQEIGVLEDSYVIFTSDHGELFERGFIGHGFQFMYEGVLHIPLLIHAPGQSSRNDIFSPTSITDLLPTLLHLSDREIPSDIDGKLLPGFGGMDEPERPIFALYGVENSAFAPLKKCVIAMRKGAYKLIAYMGYKDFDNVFELYDLSSDPEETVDLVTKESRIFSRLKQEFLFHLENANRPFVK